MWGVKLGGSLAGSPLLQEWLSLLADCGGGRVIIVPGGGPFANAVRNSQSQWAYDDRTAHRMAILATEQYGLMMEGLDPRLFCAATEAELRKGLAQNRVPIWLAWPMVINDPGLPQDWSCSSDSLALWLAIRMQADALILVKSAPLPCPSPSLAALGRAGMLDTHFAALAPGYTGALRWLTAGQCEEMRSAVAQGTLPGSVPGSGS